MTLPHHDQAIAKDCRNRDRKPAEHAWHGGFWPYRHLAGRRSTIRGGAPLVIGPIGPMRRRGSGRRAGCPGFILNHEPGEITGHGLQALAHPLDLLVVADSLG